MQGRLRRQGGGDRWRLNWALFCAALLVSACASSQVVVKQLPSPIVSIQEDRLDEELVRQALGPTKPEPYRIGPGDSLLVAVYGHPELSLADHLGGLVLPSNRTGLVVDTDGTVQLPLLGSVNVEGQTSEQLRQYLETALVPYVNEPRVNVQVLFAGSLRYNFLGQFTQPGMKYSDRPVHLLEGMALAGTVMMEGASLRGAYVARAGKRLPVNFAQLLLDGDLTQNIALKSGDVVVVPDQQREQVFVFGGASASNPRGGAVKFVDGHLTLSQALAQAGFGWKERFMGDLSDTRIIRSEGDRAQLIVVDAAAVFEGNAAPFPLAPGDVVFVPATALTNWNQALEQVLPSLQTVSGVLNPFVQMKYLSE